MIEFENTDVYGWEPAIRGMRNPMNSWDRSDSVDEWYDRYVIGENDHKLMMNLAKAGPEHAKYLRMINVTVDITAPLYFWKEYDTYKVGTVSNSCSTMHKIHAKKFTTYDFSYEHLNHSSRLFLEELIVMLNNYRQEFVDKKNKDYWWQIIQLLPSSYNQKRTVQLNYAVLKTIYHQRKNHKLDEWHTFCEWIETLPYSELIIDK